MNKSHQTPAGSRKPLSERCAPGERFPGRPQRWVTAPPPPARPAKGTESRGSRPFGSPLRGERVAPGPGRNRAVQGALSGLQRQVPSASLVSSQARAAARSARSVPPRGCSGSGYRLRLPLVINHQKRSMRGEQASQHSFRGRCSLGSGDRRSARARLRPPHRASAPRKAQRDSKAARHWAPAFWNWKEEKAGAERENARGARTLGGAGATPQVSRSARDRRPSAGERPGVSVRLECHMCPNAHLPHWWPTVIKARPRRLSQLLLDGLTQWPSSFPGTSHRAWPSRRQHRIDSIVPSLGHQAALQMGRCRPPSSLCLSEHTPQGGPGVRAPASRPPEGRPQHIHMAPRTTVALSSESHPAFAFFLLISCPRPHPAPASKDQPSPPPLNTSPQILTSGSAFRAKPEQMAIL